ncbi:alpha-(1,3)-fucosyltransferase C-like [Daphnia carinata]|uniref:alpha-(1,3)-fucosyltransferase C-like n=1 Tax=Daphnia carinata TaxID=120202 RepID=UPI00257E0A06|nr:alpha-(1,3)-fucosyltransferase C-like [Daphnia carinata]
MRNTAMFQLNIATFVIFVSGCLLLLIFHQTVKPETANTISHTDDSQKDLTVSDFVTSTENSTNKLPLKLILLWNAMSPELSDNPFVTFNCPVKTCLFTADMSLIHLSDVVLLRIDVLEDMPLNRLPHQRFVFLHIESPISTKLSIMDNPRFRYNYFNWTMTYRRDSDIFLRDYYGSVMPHNSMKGNNIFERTKIQNESIGKEVMDNDTDLAAIIRGKKKMVAWFVSHCSTLIRREEYARQLGQYVPVDIFGNCTKECPTDCDEMLRKDYKFYLAFENSWCPDYVTEKFIRPLFYHAVPIVLGGADYSHFAPPHSYINARDFGSPKELADYLILLNNTETLYTSYFDWKKDYEIVRTDMSGWCDLCQLAHNDSLPVKVYPDIKQWWMLDDAACEYNSTKYF